MHPSTLQLPMTEDFLLLFSVPTIWLEKGIIEKASCGVGWKDMHAMHICLAIITTCSGQVYKVTKIVK